MVQNSNNHFFISPGFCGSELLGWVVLALDLSCSCSQMVAGTGTARGGVAGDWPVNSLPYGFSVQAGFGFSYTV